MQPGSRSRFKALVEEAGIGSLIWSRSSYLAATYYHDIVAFFTSTILLLSLLSVTEWYYAIGVMTCYLVYFLLRRQMKPELERMFYQPNNQFWRAQISFLAITLTMVLFPGAEHTTLWLLYVPIILLMSKHCTTRQMVVLVIESATAWSAIRLWRQAPFDIAPLFERNSLDIAVEVLWLAFLAFILHYLVRNLQARDATIAAYYAVSKIAGDVDMSDTQGAKPWQPLLEALLRNMDGDCASVWMTHAQSRQLQLIASVCRHCQNRDEVVFNDRVTEMTLPLDDSTVIASVALSGEPQSSYLRQKTDRRIYTCPGCCPISTDVSAEIAIPINLGTVAGQSVIGVLSVGFFGKSFKARLLSEYQNFMQSLVNLARPMLAYAQRVDELAALQQVSRQVSQCLDLDQVLDNILKAIVETLGFEFAVVSLVDPDRRVIRSVRGLNVEQKWIDMAVHALDSNDIQADIVRTGKTEVLSDWDDRFDRRIWDEFNHKDMVRIFTPISVIDETTHQIRVIGTIEAGYQRSTRTTIDTHQRRVLEAFVNHAAMAVEQAQLLERIRKKAEILTSLHRVGQVIASARQPSQVLAEIARNAASLLHADIVMLYSYQHEKHKLEPPVIFGDVGPQFSPKLDLSQQNVLTRLLSETQPYYSADAPHDPLLITQNAGLPTSSRSKRTFIQRQNIKSFAGIPLIAQGETVGIMFVNYRTRHRFDPDEMQVHELFAQQAAVALKNAQVNELERELAVREERDHLSRELHLSVSQALYGIKLKAYNAMKRCVAQDDGVHAELANILDIAHLASNETCFIIDELRAPLEEGHNLIAGLEEYTQRIKKWYGIDVVLEMENPYPLPQLVEQKLLRFAREALNNAIHHSKCQTIRVCLQVDLGKLELAVHDDGTGFDPSRVPPRKLGLTSMREWATAVGGTFRLETKLGSGTTVCIQILSEEEADYE